MTKILVILLLVLTATGCGSAGSTSPTATPGMEPKTEALEVTERPSTPQTGICDILFQNQLVFQRAANTGDRMNQIIQIIQENKAECGADTWRPVVLGEGQVVFTCGTDGTIGGFEIPETMSHLMEENAQSGRDGKNNILVYLIAQQEQRCWMYLSELARWGEERK